MSHSQEITCHVNLLHVLKDAARVIPIFQLYISRERALYFWWLIYLWHYPFMWCMNVGLFAGRYRAGDFLFSKKNPPFLWLVHMWQDSFMCCMNESREWRILVGKKGHSALYLPPKTLRHVLHESFVQRYTANEKHKATRHVTWLIHM